MIKVLSIEEFWKERSNRLVIDVRTPAEYARGHIPGALNLPLFSNEERAVVGTIYTQESPDKALLKGLDFAGKKLRGFVEKARELAPSGKIALHCWRGGKRSSSMAWLLDLAGFDVQVLNGGYKSYKNYIRQRILEENCNLMVLGGKTGAGKTRIIKALSQKGEQVIDLEKLACHKGSAFGWLGEIEQPTSEQFENDLFEQLLKLNPRKRIWIENESRSIGNVYLPDGFWEKMKNAPLINIEIPFEQRVQTLVDDYSRFPKEELLASFYKIKKRLGGQNLKEAEMAIEENDFRKAAEIALTYYDKSYQFLLENNKAPEIHQIRFERFDPEQNAIELINFSNSISYHHIKQNV